MCDVIGEIIFRTGGESVSFGKGPGGTILRPRVVTLKMLHLMMGEVWAENEKKSMYGNDIPVGILRLISDGKS